MHDFITFSFPLDALSVIAGGIVGFFLVFLVDFIKKPRVKDLGFSVEKVNFGTLYKVRFKLKGKSTPGLTRMTISWCCNKVFAKWDEAPNPIDEDDMKKFNPVLVPSTYDQPIFCGNEYNVPIVINDNSKYEIFSGWWFGKNKGYGPDPSLNSSTKITLTLTGGSGLLWSKEFTISELLILHTNEISS
ncbi:MAG: hypothetical protein AB2558_20465 [Candidatus Thiodiazotropha sp.]